MTNKLKSTEDKENGIINKNIAKHNCHDKRKVTQKQLNKHKGIHVVLPTSFILLLKLPEQCNLTKLMITLYPKQTSF